MNDFGLSRRGGPDAAYAREDVGERPKLTHRGR